MTRPDPNIWEFQNLAEDISEFVRTARTSNIRCQDDLDEVQALHLSFTARLRIISLIFAGTLPRVPAPSFLIMKELPMMSTS